MKNLILIIGILFVSLIGKSQVNLGDSYGGGTVGYILQSGDPGYDAAVQKGFIYVGIIDTYADWGCQGTTTGATGTAIGTGVSNTAAIIANCSEAGISAKLCVAYTGGGYSDWYLPSINEWHAIFNARASNNFSTLLPDPGNNGFDMHSSSEYNGSYLNAIVFRSSDGVWASYHAGKSYVNSHVTIPIRSFSISAPIITTNSISSIAQTTASGGGNVTSDGGKSVTARGICWNTSTNPTTANSHTTDGSGTGSFSSSLSSLSGNTLYYVRAYATNSIGTSYGSDVTFTTLDLPTVTTTAASIITAFTASSGGNVTFDGNTTVTARGVCWNTSTNPTTANSHTTDGSGTGSFSSSLTSLIPVTFYYIRAYATNSIGTAYGSNQTFTTLSSGNTLLFGSEP